MYVACLFLSRFMQAPMAVAEMFGEACPASAPFFGYMGAAAALIFASEFPRRIIGTRIATVASCGSDRRHPCSGSVGPATRGGKCFATRVGK